MKKLLISFITLVVFTTFSFADAGKYTTEISEKDREKLALTALRSSPNKVQIYAKGLVCESCGIGVRKELQKLKFVDTSKPKKGIVIDVKSQLVSVAVKHGKFANIEAIKKAIKRAGYEPVKLYELKDNKLKSISLEG